MDKSLARELFSGWNAALATGEAAFVADCYASDAILVPTLSRRVRCDRQGIIDYFVEFLQKRPNGIITEDHVHAFGDTLVHSGLYTFVCRSAGKDRPIETLARFTFVYRRRANAWEIIAHHSSLPPDDCG